MESKIKILATRPELELLNTYSEHCLLKDADYIKSNVKGAKNKNLYKILLRHNDNIGELYGTYTIKKLLEINGEDKLLNMIFLINGIEKQYRKEHRKI